MTIFHVLFIIAIWFATIVLLNEVNEIWGNDNTSQKTKVKTNIFRGATLFGALILTSIFWI